MTESEISSILNVFMYLNYHEAVDGQTLSSIINKISFHPEYGGGGKFFHEYTVIKQAVTQHPSLGNLQISCQSWNKGYDSGTAACVFEDQMGSYYVVYRGTGDGEWIDNGKGMVEEETPQQSRALQYFEEVVKEKKINGSSRVIVTGHSKGGNKAQFVTMEEKNNIVSVCYSIDGQGFSDKAISKWNGIYSQEKYKERIEKLHGIAGENDYVHVLGTNIISQDNIKYVMTPAAKGNLAAYHDIKYMYAQPNEEGEVIFAGTRNPYIMNRGKLAGYVSVVAEKMMELPEDKCLGSSISIMQFLELGGENKKGLDGEGATWEDFFQFLSSGLPVIGLILVSPKIRNEIYESIFGVWQKNASFYTNLKTLQEESNHILLIKDKINAVTMEVENIYQQLQINMKGARKIHRHIKGVYQNMYEEAARLGELALLLEKTAQWYLQCER